MRVVPRQLPRGIELACRYKGSPAAVVRQQLHSGARRLEHRRRRDAILGLVVIGEGVVEEDGPAEAGLHRSWRPESVTLQCPARATGGVRLQADLCKLLRERLTHPCRG